MQVVSDSRVEAVAYPDRSFCSLLFLAGFVPSLPGALSVGIQEEICSIQVLGLFLSSTQAVPPMMSYLKVER